MDFTSFSSSVFFPVLRSNTGQQVAFSHHASWVSSNLWRWYWFFLFPMTLTLLRHTVKVFYIMAFNLGLFNVFSWLDRGYVLLEDFHRSEALLTASFQGVDEISLIITGDNNIYHFLKVVSARFLQYKGIFCFLYSTLISSKSVRLAHILEEGN